MIPVFLTDEEVDQVLARALEFQPASADELADLADWCNSAALDPRLVTLILDGSIAMSWDSEAHEPRFRIPT